MSTFTNILITVKKLNDSFIPMNSEIMLQAAGENIHVQGKHKRTQICTESKRTSRMF